MRPTRQPIEETLGLSPYIEPPTIPEGMTIDEYRRARAPQPKPLAPQVFSGLRRLALIAEEQARLRRPSAGLTRRPLAT
jgi:hypothetical protein